MTVTAPQTEQQEQTEQTACRPWERERTRILIAVSAVLAVATAMTALAVASVRPPGVPMHVVHDLTGRGIVEVRVLAEQHSWVLDEDQQRIDGIALDTVVAQYPPPGARLAEGELLAVNVAAGPTLTPMPRVAGRSVDEAARRLREAGFSVELVQPVFDAETPADTVLSAQADGVPAVEGTLLERGAAIALAVSAGPPPVIVPDLTGMTLEQALAAASELGLLVAAAPERLQSEAQRVGQVVSQQPAAGFQSQVGDQVTVVLSSGAQPG